jgi:hypothetical protein
MFRKHLLASCAAGLAAVLVPIASASALPLGGSGTVLQPAATSATAPRRLGNIVITTDSVVATATVEYDGPAGDIAVRWGDGAISRPTATPTASVPGHPATPTAAGTFVLQHVYSAPTAGTAFPARVSVVVTGRPPIDRDITITPRYRVTQYTLFFSPLNHCDTALEEYTEWIVGRSGGGGPDARWAFDRKTHVRGEVGDPLPDFQPIPNSALSLEVTAADAPRIVFGVIEVDPFIDDLAETDTIDLHPGLGSRPVVLHFADQGAPPESSACRAEIRTDIDVRLLTPGLSTGPVASQ